MLFQCWAGVEDGGPTLKQHWIIVSCLPGWCPTSPLLPVCWSVPFLNLLDMHYVDVFINCFNHLNLSTIPFISNIDAPKEIYEDVPHWKNALAIT